MGKSNSKKLKDEQKKSYEKFCQTQSTLLNNIFTNGEQKNMSIIELKYLKKQSDIEYLLLFQKLIIEIIDDEDKLKETYPVLKYIQFDIFTNPEEKRFFLDFMYKFYKFLIEICGGNPSSSAIFKAFLRRIFEDSYEKKIKFNLVNDMLQYLINLNSSDYCLFGKMFYFWEEKNSLLLSNQKKGNFFSNLKEILKKISYLLLTPQIVQSQVVDKDREDCKQAFKLFNMIGRTEKLSWITNDSILNYIIYKFFEHDKSPYPYSIYFFIFQIELVDKISPNAIYFILSNLINFLILYICHKKNQEKFIVIYFYEIQCENYCLNSNESDTAFNNSASKYEEELFLFHKEFLFYFNYTVNFPFCLGYKFFIEQENTLENIGNFVRVFERALSLEITFNDQDFRRSNFESLFSNLSYYVSEDSVELSYMPNIWIERKILYNSNTKSYLSLMRKYGGQLTLKIEMSSEQIIEHFGEEIISLNYIISQIDFDYTNAFFLKIFTNYAIDLEVIMEWYEKFYKNYKNYFMQFDEYALIVNNMIIKFFEKTFIELYDTFLIFIRDVVANLKNSYSIQNINNILFEESVYHIKEYLKNLSNNIIFISMNKKFCFNLNIYAIDVYGFYQVVSSVYSQMMKYFNEILLLQGINLYLNSGNFFEIQDFPSYFFLFDSNFNELINLTTIYLVDTVFDDMFISYNYNKKICKIHFEEFSICQEKVKSFLNTYLNYFFNRPYYEEDSKNIYLKLLFTDIKSIKKKDIDLLDFNNLINEDKEEIQFEFNKEKNISFNFPSSSLLDTNTGKDIDNIQYEIFYILFDMFLRTISQDHRIIDVFFFDKFETFMKNINNVSKKTSMLHSFHNVSNKIIYQITLFGNLLIFNVEFDLICVEGKENTVQIDSMVISSSNFILIREFLILINSKINRLEINLEEDFTIGKEKINKINHFGQVFENYDNNCLEHIKVDSLSLMLNLITENDSISPKENKFQLIRERINIVYITLSNLADEFDLILNVKSPAYYDYNIDKIKDMLDKIPDHYYYNTTFSKIMLLISAKEKIWKEKKLSTNKRLLGILKKFTTYKKTINVTFI